MGSFTCGTLSLTFRTDVPDDVLAAFSRLPAGGEHDDTAPHLPEPVTEPSDWWEPDYEEAGWGDPDPFAAEPWRHDWAPHVSTAMGVTTHPRGRLIWTGTAWHLDCCFSWKTDAESAFSYLEWLGAFTEAPSPQFIGTLHYEYDEHPHLVWSHDGAWRLERLDPDEDAVAPPPDRPAVPEGAGTLVVVTGLPGSGRSAHVSSLQRHRGWHVYDDYQAGAFGNDPDPRMSRHFGEVVAQLRRGATVVVSDRRYCSDAELTALVTVMMAMAPFTVLTIDSFGNDPEECRRRIADRARVDPDYDAAFELAELQRQAPAYRPRGRLIRSDPR